MLMMLAWFRVWPEAIAVEAHDAGLFPGFGQKPLQLIDSHDAGLVPGFGQRTLQLMLVMLARVRNLLQLMLMILAQFRNLGKGHCS